MPGHGGIFGQPVREAVEAVGGVIDAVHTSDAERLEAARLERAPVHETNITEARHASVFVAGWRPFIGWVLGVCLAYAFIVRDLLAWVFVAFGADFPALPDLDIGEVVTLTVGMLGLAGLRTGERMNGVHCERLRS